MPVLLGELLTGASQLNFAPDWPGGEVVVVVGDVLADAVGPAVVAGLLDDVELDAALRAAVRVGRAGVRAVVAHQHPAGLRVDRDPERVAEAHRVDLGHRLRLAVGREEVVGRDRVRRPDAGRAGRVADRRDAEDLAVGVVRVRRRALGVPVLAAGPLVDRGEAARVERVRVVAGRDVEAAVGRGGERAAGVAALGDLVLPGVDDPLGAGDDRVVLDREAREAVLLGAVRERGVAQVEVAGGVEVVRQRDAEQAVLLALRDRDRPRGRGLARGGVPDLDAPVALDVEHAPVGRDVHLHRVLRVVVEGDLLEVTGDGILRRSKARRHERGHDGSEERDQRKAGPTHGLSLPSPGCGLPDHAPVAAF